jgi:hypothetical protein
MTLELVMTHNRCSHLATPVQHISCKPTLLAVDGAELARNDVVFDLEINLVCSGSSSRGSSVTEKTPETILIMGKIKRFKCDRKAVQPQTMCTPAISTLIPLDTSSAAATLVDISSSSMVDISLATSADNAEERVRVSYSR